jgi:hypothetical protein
MIEDEIQERIEELKRISRDYAGDRQIDHLCRIIVSLEKQRNALMWMLDNGHADGSAGADTVRRDVGNSGGNDNG